MSKNEKLLKIERLHVTAGDKPILRGMSLEVARGEVVAIMGPNGSGKSTLAKVIAGSAEYEIVRGRVLYKGHDLEGMAPEDRARAGIFLGFQTPIEIPGVTNGHFLKAAVNAVRKARSLPEYDGFEFMDRVQECLRFLEMDPVFLERGVNSAFSGGERKRNEILQLLLLEPCVAVLDETDSGLDIDALKVVAKGVNRFRGADRAVVLITHYQRLLDLIVPDRVLVLSQGKIVRSGGKELALELERTGYGPVPTHEKVQGALV